MMMTILMSVAFLYSSSRVEGKTGALITQWLLYRGAGKKFTSSAGTSSRRPSLGKALGSSRKVSRSFCSSRKKMSKSVSSSPSGGRQRPFSFGSDASKYKIEMTKTQEVKLDTRNSSEEVKEGERRRLNLNKNFPKSRNLSTRISQSNSETSSTSVSTYKGSSSPSNSFTSSSSSSSSSTSSSPSTSSAPSSSSSSPTNQPHQKRVVGNLPEIAAKEAVLNQKLSSQSFNHYGDSLNNKTSTLKGSTQYFINNNDETNLGSGQKSFSTSSIAAKPDKKMKASTSLWSVYSKSPLKKVLTILL